MTRCTCGPGDACSQCPAIADDPSAVGVADRPRGEAMSLRRIDITYRPLDPDAPAYPPTGGALDRIEVHGHEDEHGDTPPVDVAADEVAAAIEMLRNYYSERWFA